MQSFVIENDWLPRGILDFGWGNGYVAIPKGHILHGVDYMEIHNLLPDLDVNWGLTYSNHAKAMIKDLIPEGCEDSWIVGFDTAHYNDTLKQWSKEEVINETEYLKIQLIELTKDNKPLLEKQLKKYTEHENYEKCAELRKQLESL